jgi:NADH dehydrogenase
MQILILGAGYAGLRVALDLGREAQDAALSVTLVDQNPYHQVIQLLHLTATAGNHSREAIYDLDRLLRDRAVRRVEGRAQAIEPLARSVTLADGQRLPYDRLVIALGAETSYAGVPGAAEHSLPLRTYAQALRLRDHLIGQFATAAQAADPTERRILMTTAIVGGGYTGCQLAGELAAWADQLSEETGAPRGEARIALIDRGPSLLRQFGPWATGEAERVLDRAGVSVYLSTPVTAVEPRLLRVGDGRVLRAATIVWAGGLRGPALLAAAGLPADDQGRVLVDRYLRVQGQAAIFALGDCAAIPDGAEGVTVPATASYATRQGEHVAAALLAEAAGEAPRAYEPLKLGELVSLGPHEAVGNPLGVPVTGYPALLLKKGVEQFYRASIES